MTVIESLSNKVRIEAELARELSRRAQSYANALMAGHPPSSFGQQCALAEMLYLMNRIEGNDGCLPGLESTLSELDHGRRENWKQDFEDDLFDIAQACERRALGKRSHV